MDEKEKLSLISSLIENRFNIERFSDFVARVLNVTVRDRKPSTAIWKEYRNYIESYQILGDYTDKDGQKNYIIVVKTKDSKDPTRAKGKQREIIAKILREYRKAGALVAFYNDSDSHWRMAFVKLEYTFTEKGIKEKLTPAKRLSYVVGEGEASHTVKKQMMTLTKINDAISLDELEKLFQLEKVTNEFFDDYKKKYLDLKEYLETNSEFMVEAKRQNMENPESFSEGFAKKLMGQLAFLYFLQKKGWLGVKIVPTELSNEDFNAVYDRAIGDEKDILSEAFSMANSGNYKLNPSKVMEMDIKDADNLASAFKNIVKFEEPWGSGDKKFIRTLFERHITIKKNTGKGRTFFNDYLEYMFYDALNLDRGANQYFKRFNCKIPFLNGGLFEPYDDYDWKNTDFKIPDEIFSNSKGDGILDIFDRYNFTINENEPYETEVAVDPEMLGKVFENLLDVKDRKSKGAFYTPREIVHYMCKESIINYLMNEVADLTREDIDYLIQLGEFTKEYDEHLFEMDYMKALEEKNTMVELVWGMPEFIRNNAKLIDDALKNVKVADPAIGSGAFPLGMLNEIVKARNTLTQYIIIAESLETKDLNFDKYRVVRDKAYRTRSLYRLKIETIENSLYGVDIEPSAVEIAKLRLWLSIVVDTQNNDIRPLPNLDFNFMSGNSLLEEFEGVKLFDEKLLKKNLKETYTEAEKLNAPTLSFQKGLFGGIEDLKIDIMMKLDELHKKFFKERNNEVKKNIKRQIEDTEWILIQETLSHSGNSDKIKELEKLRKQKRKPYFLWKLEFARVFQEKGGFDIVIGNPPYIGFHKVPHKEESKKIFYSANGKYDFYVLFIEKAVNLLKNKGNLTYICPSYFYKRNYGQKLREFLLRETNIKLIIDFQDSQIFETAQTYTCIFSTEKEKSNRNNLIKIKENLDFNGKELLLEQENLIEPQWIIQKDSQNGIVERCKKNSKISLADITTSISQGIVTGNNSVYLISEKTIKEYGMNYNYLKKAYKGKDIKNGKLIESNHYVFYPYNFDKNNKNVLVEEKEIEEMNPQLLKYLVEHKEELLTREYFLKSNKKWYELWNPRKALHFYNRKFVFSEINNKNDFVLTNECFYTDSACGFELKKEYQEFEDIIEKYLNSNIATDLLKQISVPKANGYFIYKNSFLKDFPIVIDLKNEEEITSFKQLKSEEEIDKFIYGKIFKNDEK